MERKKSQIKKSKPRLGNNQKKVLLLLSAGVALGFSRSPSAPRRIFKALAKEWKMINQRALNDAINSLYVSRLIREELNKDGSITMVLSDTGEERTLRFRYEDIQIRKPERWDKKWRIVLFDIPETQKKTREAFRGHLKRMGFYEFQKSVFVHPHECRNEIDFLIEFHQARKYIRFIVAESLDNELHLKSFFNL